MIEELYSPIVNIVSCGVNRVTKFFKSVGTQLEMADYDRLIEICQREGCTPYAILKDLVTDYIKSYPENGPKAPQQKLDEIGDGLDEPGTRTGKDKG